MSATTTTSLRERLIGAWKLVSYVEQPVDGSAPFYPFGETPQGIIMYTPDGFMSAQLCHAQRTPFASGDWFKGTPEEYEAEASSYIAYTGPFHVDEDAAKASLFGGLAASGCSRSPTACSFRCSRTGKARPSRAW